MYCRWCGMESRTEDKCEWCHRPLGDREQRPLDERDSPAPWDLPPTTPLSRHGDRDLKHLDELPADSAFDALTKSRKVTFPDHPEAEAPPERPKAPPPAPAPPARRSRRRASPERLRATRPLEEAVRTSSARAAAETSRAGTPFGYRLEKFLGLAGVVVAAAMAIIRAAPGAWWPVGAGALFLCGLFLATSRCGAPFESDFPGVVALVAFTVAGGAAGPLAALAGYLFFALLVRSLNPTTLAVGFTNAIVTGLLVAMYSLSSGSAFFTNGSFYEPARIYVYFSFILTILGGWVSSSLLLPLNE